MKIIERPDGSREIEGTPAELAEYDRNRVVHVGQPVQVPYPQQPVQVPTPWFPLPYEKVWRIYTPYVVTSGTVSTTADIKVQG